MTARLRVERAGPLVTLQDAGRPGLRRWGIPPSGPMDRTAHAAANLAAGNHAGATAIEVSAGGLAVEVVGGQVTVAVTGGDPRLERDGLPADAWTVRTLRPGTRLDVRPGSSGSWAYLAIAGAAGASRWLGSTATLATAGLGGGSLRAGDVVEVPGPPRPERDGPVPPPPSATDHGTTRVVLGPQDACFAPDALHDLVAAAWTVTAHGDRMGIRLDGPALVPHRALALPSGPVVRGSLQVDGTGAVSLLLADHQTTGGYPRIATVLSCDVDAASQRPAGAQLRFTAVEPSAAVAAARLHAEQVDAYLTRVAGPDRTLHHRLARQNLIARVEPQD